MIYPVDTLVLAVKKGAPEAEIVSSTATRHEVKTRMKLPSMKQQRVWLAVHRYDDSVYYRRLGREAFLLLRSLHSGATVSEAVGHAFENAKLNVEQQAAVLRESFAHASELGWFCLPETEEDSRLLVM